MGGNAPSTSTPAYPGDYGTQGNFKSGAYPGSLNYATAVTDVKGNFWLFGGYGMDPTRTYGELNDLWEYDPTTNEWAWITGSTTVESGGSYGSLQTPAPGNSPCSRLSAVMWADNLGNLWLFGGFGFPPNGEGYLNDLWEFNPTTGYWAWMAGNNTMGIVPPPIGSNNAPGSGWVGIYGNLGAAAPATTLEVAFIPLAGPTAVAISGSLAAKVSTPSETMAISTTFGSSAPLPTSGRGWEEATSQTSRACIRHPQALPSMASPVGAQRLQMTRTSQYMPSLRQQPPAIPQEPVRRLCPGRIRRAIYGSWRVQAWTERAGPVI